MDLEKTMLSSLAEINSGFSALHDLRRRSSNVEHLSRLLERPELALADLDALHVALANELQSSTSETDIELCRAVQEQNEGVRDLKDRQRKTLLSESPASTVSRQLALAISASRRVTTLLRERQSKQQSVLTTTLQRYQHSGGRGGSAGGGLLGEVLDAELRRLSGAAVLHEVILPCQDFSDPRRLQALLDTVSSHPGINHIDLAGCLLGTSNAVKILQAVSSHTSLRTMNLSGNCLDESFVDRLEASLSDPVGFLGLRRLVVADNVGLSAEIQNVVDQMVAEKESVAARTAIEDPSWSIRDGDQKLRLLCLDGLVMKSAVQPRALIELGATRRRSARFDVIAASSFATITAAAMCLGIDLEAVEKFFVDVATAVFAHGHYSYYGVVGGRFVRSWWTGGDYYSSAAFRAQVAGLFGNHADISLAATGRLSGVKLLLYAESVDAHEPRVFRNFIQAGGTGVGTTLAAVRDPERVSLLDAVMACCATRTLFAPALVAGCGGKLQDAMTNPVLPALAECLQHHSLSNIEVLSLGCGSQSGCDAVDAANVLVSMAAAKVGAAELSKTASSATVEAQLCEWSAAIQHEATHRTVSPLFASLGAAKKLYTRYPLRLAIGGVEISMIEENAVLLQTVLTSELMQQILNDSVSKNSM